MTGRPSRREVGRSLARQMPLLIGLVVLWMCLWSQFTVLAFVTGVAVALLVTRVFFLPPVELSGRFNIWYALVFLAHFVVDLVRASVQVAWQAVGPRGVHSNAIVAVQLHTRSDFIMTLVAEAISLVPGSLVVEADRERSILYLHALGVSDADEVEAVRSGVLVVEKRIARVLGSTDDLRRIADGTPAAAEVHDPVSPSSSSEGGPS
ncbi:MULTISPECIES: Na+/H+ antiporter subunit E [Frigoribacterium]|uniref:Na+/H+ antiporter subunit E n=1 Tax=Frigoribacterium TaxID=96492 RepID=UPI001782EBD8|nr:MULTISPECIES: Na+/H+ antiporter subunit E [Frigoribacterium]MBD8702419.1 Na+/H+ antiporter subunit E [Frigoribacterium sp. CFBP 13712]MCJ0699698.1 Na+/H+ antiporter subunit E [Frigoribacterium faeni]MDY0891295.1 Na+/H+ antiporter subunit E [Frigoribacterium sp. CFBP9030]